VFQDFDITKNGHVTKQQFLRVVDSLKITAPEAITQLVLRRYMDKGNVDEVNYVDFCEDVDGSKELFGVGRDFNHSFSYFPKTQPFVSNAEIVRNNPDDLNDTIARIRTMCAQQRIRVGEFFRDFDKLRTGYITNSQFRIGLNMAKVVISAGEFKLLTQHFKAPKEGEHICWKDFVDHVDEVFTKKGLEKSVDIVLNDVRTSTVYGRREATADERNTVSDIVFRFQDVVRKNRLDAKSFFQDFDLHKHFKVTPKIFRQVLTTHGFPLSEEEVNCVALVYGSEAGEIKYAEFLKDCNVLKFEIYGPTTLAKSTYTPKFIDYDGEREFQQLMQKIKNIIKRDRIRLLEFFQDHDMLRKGAIPPTKFRTTLHSQKV
jgi:Ca2+-binding EF-hand superfamily protein